MKDQLTHRDIDYLAKSYFESYFYWKIYPKSRPWYIVAGLAFIALIAVAIATPRLTPMVATNTTAIVEQSTLGFQSPALAVATIAFAVITGVTLCLGVFAYMQAKDEFCHAITDKWDAGDNAIPNKETVIEYLKARGVID